MSNSVKCFMGSLRLNRPFEPCALRATKRLTTGSQGSDGRVEIAFSSLDAQPMFWPTEP